MDLDFSKGDSVPFAPADSPDEESLSEFESPPVNQPMQTSAEPMDPKTSHFLYLTRSKEERQPDAQRWHPTLRTHFEWHEEHKVKVPKLMDPPQRDESDMKLRFQPQTGKKDMELGPTLSLWLKSNSKDERELIVKCKHPLSKWLESNPKHQRDLIDFNGVVQSESTRKSLEKRWRREAYAREAYAESESEESDHMMLDLNCTKLEMEERGAMKTDEERNRIVAHVKVSCLDSSKHQQLQKYMNSMQKESDDILEINMAEKPNWESSDEKKKWKVIGLINPNVNLSTLDHSLNLISMPQDSHGISILNYHHWIPSVFQLNSKGMDSPQLFCLFLLSLRHHSAP